jgi:hypothetical protein
MIRHRRLQAQFDDASMKRKAKVGKVKMDEVITVADGADDDGIVYFPLLRKDTGSKGRKY